MGRAKANLVVQQVLRSNGFSREVDLEKYILHEEASFNWEYGHLVDILEDHEGADPVRWLALAAQNYFESIDDYWPSFTTYSVYDQVDIDVSPNIAALTSLIIATKAKVESENPPNELIKETALEILEKSGEKDLAIRLGKDYSKEALEERSAEVNEEYIRLKAGRDFGEDVNELEDLLVNLYTFSGFTGIFEKSEDYHFDIVARLAAKSKIVNSPDLENRTLNKILEEQLFLGNRREQIIEKFIIDNVDQELIPGLREAHNG